MNIGIILAAGKSSRFGGSMYKQYLKLNGKEVVSYSLQAMRGCPSINKIILVVNEEEYLDRYIEKKYNVECVAGADSRNKSIKNVITYIATKYPEAKKILFHDAARPFVTSDTLQVFFEKLDEYEAVVSVAEITDALTDIKLKHVDRTEFCQVQTPEAFLMSILNEFDENSQSNAIVSQFSDKKIFKVQSDILNLKINYPQDLFFAEQIDKTTYYKANDRIEECSGIEDVLLLGSSGGIGSVLSKYFEDNNINCWKPKHSELDLENISVENIEKYMQGNKPKVIINTAAAYADDEIGLSSTFDKIFSINVKSNLVIIEYAKTLNQRVNIIVFSSSSSSKGRKNLTNYSSSKAALNSVVESQADVLAAKDIFLNAIIPEKVDTPLISKLHKTSINTRELLSPSDIVSAVKYYSITKEYGKLVNIRKGL